MTVDHEFLEEVVQKELGFPSVDEFIRLQAYAIFQQKLAETQAIVTRYEAKYGMSLAEFQHRIGNVQDETLREFGLIEKEDDSLTWEFEQRSLPYYHQRLEQLAA